MNILAEINQARNGKKQTVYAKKTRLPIQFKTKKHKCSQCTRTDATQHFLTEKESRWLCPLHVVMNNRREINERPHFIKASRL